MPDLKEMEPGVMFWAERDEMDEIRALGVGVGQMAIPGDMELNAAAAKKWKANLADFRVITVFATYRGEDYADIPTVQRTVGFIPPATRAEREQRTLDVSDFAAQLGVRSIACHVGFVPEDQSDPDYIAVRDLVRRVCDRAAKNGQTFALETGQEPAPILLAFLRDVDRPNIGINFDPANLILYGSGDPIEALGVLYPHILSVHCKDGDWPPKGVPGALGSERPLGDGAVGMERFVGALAKAGFHGPLNVERETENQAQRLKEISGGIQLLRRLLPQ